MNAARHDDAESRVDLGLRLLSITTDAALVLESGRVSFANDAAARALGYSMPSELHGKALGDLVEPAHDGPVKARAKDGAARLELSTHPVALGLAAATLAVLRDGGMRTNGERARIESELRLRESQRLAQIGSWELDLVTNRLVWSDEIYRIFELDPASFGASYDAFLAAIHPDDRAKVDTAYRQSVAERTPYEIDHRLVMDDGRVKHVQERGRTFYEASGTPLRSIGTVQDVTSRVVLEEQLRLRDAAVAGSATPIVFADLEGKITSVNAAFVRCWGYDDATQLLGRSAVEFWAEPDKAGAALAGVQQTGHQVGELVAKRRDGTTFIVQFVAAIARGADGKPLGLMGHFVDITAQVEAQRALAAREAQLRQAQKLDAVGRLAGGIAHDFNNVLTVVLSLGHSLADLVHGQPHALELVNDILSAAQRAAGLTRQLLAFARVGHAAPRVIDLGQKVRDFSRMMTRLIGEDVTLSIDVAPGPHLVLLDPTHLEQVLLNLAANARDAMVAGGTLTVSIGAGTHDALPQPGRCVHLALRDTGQGMTEQVRSRIFEPFFTTKEAGRGTGLGLATVHGIVTQAGGAITVDSAPGAGTTFHLFFPAADAATASVTPVPAAPESGRGERILLVEDEPAVRTVTARLLSSAGYAVTEAADGQAAIAAVRSNAAFDLILTDVVMPGMSGPAVIRELARTQRSAPVLFMSGYAPDEAALENLGRLVRKPFTRDTLLAAVRGVLEERAHLT